MQPRLTGIDHIPELCRTTEPGYPEQVASDCAAQLLAVLARSFDPECFSTLLEPEAISILLRCVYTYFNPSFLSD